MKFKYVGTDEKHIPSLGITVKPGETIECNYIINHPDFIEVSEAGKKPKKK